MRPGTLLLRSVWRTIFVALAICNTLTFSQTLKVLHTFNQTDGEFPNGLIHGSDGNFYGTTFGGGTVGCGTVFKISPSGAFTSIYSFNEFVGNDGCLPTSPVIRDAAGNLYGTTTSGGAYNAGTVFKINSSGQESVLYAFTGGADGGGPYAGVVRDSKGNLYGTALAGGNLGCYPFTNGYCGTVFKIDISGHETVVHAFMGGADGSNPFGGVVIDSDGNLYGTTELGGGGQSAGTLFKIDPSGNETVLYDFDSYTGDGNSPRTSLAFGPGKILYGTTYVGGDVNDCPPYGCGTVFKTDTQGNEAVVHAFAGGTSDGAIPGAPVDTDKAGNVYGAANSGGISQAYGLVYKLDPAGTETILHYFTNGADGAYPSGRLYVNSQGVVFGTASGGNNNTGYGVVYKITP